MKFHQIILGEKEMISLEAREIEEILKGLYPKKQAFFIGCS